MRDMQIVCGTGSYHDCWIPGTRRFKKESRGRRTWRGMITFIAFLHSTLGEHAILIWILATFATGYGGLCAVSRILNR